MPLRDHFRGDERGPWKWKSVHSQWAAQITTTLNSLLLPPGFVAIPTVQFGISGKVGDLFSELDLIEIRVYDDMGYRLVAAVELVSPANKDRPANRRVFAGKCAAYLQQHVSVVVIDVITERRESLHAELMDLLALTGESATAISSDQYAVAYRTRSEPPRLEMWPHALMVGAVMPVLTLWIGPDAAVPLDLEATYIQACQSLRMLP
jgi:hypothetical protein